MQNNNTTAEMPKLSIDEVITEKRRIQKEVPLPYYVKLKNSNVVCKVVSRDHFIKVDPDKNWWGVKVAPVNSYLSEIAEGTPITEDEYNQAFETAKTYVEQLNSDEPQDRTEDENVQIDELKYGRAI
jgi:hypothetical protein